MKQTALDSRALDAPHLAANVTELIGFLKDLARITNNIDMSLLADERGLFFSNFIYICIYKTWFFVPLFSGERQNETDDDGESGPKINNEVFSAMANLRLSAAKKVFWLLSSTTTINEPGSVCFMCVCNINTNEKNNSTHFHRGRCIARIGAKENEICAGIQCVVVVVVVVFF